MKTGYETSLRARIHDECEAQIRIVQISRTVIERGEGFAFGAGLKTGDLWSELNDL